MKDYFIIPVKVPEFKRKDLELAKAKQGIRTYKEYAERAIQKQLKRDTENVK